MKVLAEIRDKKGEIIKIIRYRPVFRDQVMELFREGYPDSFDGHDLREIKKSLHRKIEKTFLLALLGEELIGCVTGFFKLGGPYALYVGGYLYVKEDFRQRDVAKILQGVAEEVLRDKARVIIGINPGVLPDYDRSFEWFKRVGFELLGEVKYWFRDDLSGLFMGKRNPYLPIGKGISKNSGWCPELANSKTGRNISEEEYQKILRDPGLTPKEKWGLDLIGRENVIIWRV